MLFISAFILTASLDITDFALAGERIISDTADEKFVRVMLLTIFCREGVLILYLRVPLAYGMMT